MAMFGTNKQYNLERLPFTTREAFLSVYESPYDHRMYLTLARGKQGILDRPDLLRIVPVYEGEEQPVIYESDEALLTFRTPHGTVEFAYETPQILRVRVKGVSLKIFYVPRMHEGGYERNGGEVELSFEFAGRLLFVPVDGEMNNNADWNFRTVSPDPFEITMAPNASGEGNFAIHEYLSNGLRSDSYAPFDECIESQYAAFADFCRRYPELPAPYREMGRKAMYMIWTTVMGPRGTLPGPVIYMHKIGFTRAFGWHHGFHALAMKRDVKEALKYLFALFAVQNEQGGIPDQLSDLWQFNWVATKPPIYGYALLHILDTFDLSPLTREDYGDAYRKLSAYTNWWFDQHDHTRSGIPAYYTPDESGYDENSAFGGGLPASTPDLLSYTVCNCEACARLADILGKDSEAASFRGRADRILSFLINDLWNGRQFRTWLPVQKEFFDSDSLVQLTPIMLGKRLPQDIIDVLTSRLMDETEFMTEYGFSTENLRSDRLRVAGFTQGAVVSPAVFLQIFGLYDAGKTEEADYANVRFLNALLHEGLALGIHSCREEPNFSGPIRRSNSAMSVGGPFAAWVSSIYLALAERLSH